MTKKQVEKLIESYKKTRSYAAAPPSIFIPESALLAFMVSEMGLTEDAAKTRIAELIAEPDPNFQIEGGIVHIKLQDKDARDFSRTRFDI